MSQNDDNIKPRKTNKKRKKISTLIQTKIQYQQHTNKAPKTRQNEVPTNKLTTTVMNTTKATKANNDDEEPRGSTHQPNNAKIKSTTKIKITSPKTRETELSEYPNSLLKTKQNKTNNFRRTSTERSKRNNAIQTEMVQPDLTKEQHSNEYTLWR
jgi:hypothetical protein